MSLRLHKSIRAIIIATCLGLWGCENSDNTEGTIPLLQPGEIEIVVDGMGVPHIYGGTDADVFYGYGYQLAKDRMFQLEMFRRRSQGRTSEVLGESGVIPDQQAYVFNWKHWGTLDGEWMAENEPKRYALVTAYVNGINARIEEVRSGAIARPMGYGTDRYDFLPERWAVNDVFIIQKMAGFAQDLTLEFEAFLTLTNRYFGHILEGIELFKPVRNAFGLPVSDRESTETTASIPKYPTTYPKLPMTPGLGTHSELRGLTKIRGLGSNNWAVDGRHTDTGMPYLAGDPHMGIGYSGLLYAVHLDSKSSGGQYNVAGFAFVGAPGIAMGHNENVAWSPTSTFADVMDIWDVKVTDQGAHIGDEIIPIIEREEHFTVRRSGEPAGTGQEFTIVTLEVPGYGILLEPAKVGFDMPIATSGNYALLGWTGFAQRSARYFLELNTATDVDDFAAKALTLHEMTYNLVAADKSGIRYQVGADVPKRNPITAGRQPWMLMDGSDPQSFWTGEYLAKSQLPSSEGGEQGWIATANADPYGFTSDGQLDNDPFYYGAFFAPGWRADRIGDELTRLISEGPVTLADMQGIQTDTHSNLADDILPFVSAAWADATTDPAFESYAANADIAYLVDRLVNVWDRRMVRASSEAAVFHAFAHLLAEEILGDDLPIVFPVVMSLQPVYFLKVAVLTLQEQYSRIDHILQGGPQQIILRTMERTVAYLEGRFGPLTDNAFTFGDLHFAEFDNGFGLGTQIGQIATDGGESTVNVSAGNFFQDGAPADRWISDWIPMQRMVARFDGNGRPEAFVNFPMGNVSDPDSPHFNNQQDDWINGRYKRFLFTRIEVLENEYSSYRISRTPEN